MRTIETKVYQYSELSEEAKEKARKWYRDGALDYEWWDSSFDWFRATGKAIGFEIKDIFFSGFWSQGDGASFTGTYSYRPGWRKALAETCTDKDVTEIAGTLTEIQRPHFYRLTASLSKSGHYSHSHTMQIAADDCEEQLLDAARSFADWIYRQLEKEYEYLLSDDVVAESIVANEYEFTEDGDRA